MKTITIDETHKIINDIWPGIDRVPTDRQFYIVSIDFLMEQLNILRPEMPGYKANKFACEEFAWGSWFLLHRHRVLTNKDEEYNIHYGVLWGLSFKNAIGSHYNNFSITTDGLYIIDFESMQQWKPIMGQEEALWSFE
jgi:hypothetical protein